ncbi:MAG: iron permease [Methylococcaceae bacterium]|nr:iron permease [Methylococcaceae bacterium]
MFLNAVIIILREVIEASLIISIFLAFCQQYKLPRQWLFFALPLGLVIALIYAINMSTVSQWLDDVGQEVINASLHTMVYLVMVSFVTLAVSVKTGHYKKVIIGLMITGVTFASIREGSEIILYIYGFIALPDLLNAVLLGGAIGAGLGLSVGVLFYYLLVSLPTNQGIKVGLLLSLFVAGGMVLQATQLLSQADWIASQYPLWDTSNWISERSVIGQLLYALVGYEATPTPTQVIAYVSALTLMVILATFSYLHALRSQS